MGDYCDGSDASVVFAHQLERVYGVTPRIIPSCSSNLYPCQFPTVSGFVVVAQSRGVTGAGVSIGLGLHVVLLDGPVPAGKVWFFCIFFTVTHLLILGGFFLETI